MKKLTQSLSTVAQGQAGVFRVLSELILRGYRPYTPANDLGVDILLEQGLRLQVKTTMRASSHHRHSDGTFLFTLSPGARIRAGKVVAMAPRAFSTVCDFLVLWAIEVDRFWVVPAPVMDGRYTVTITPTPQWRDFTAAQVDSLKAQGLTIAEIARQLGVAPRTVTRRLTTFKEPKAVRSNLQSYENRWDLITKALASLQGLHAGAGAASRPASSGVEPVGSPAGVEPA